MQVDAGEFIGKLRDSFAVKQDAHNLAVMSAFDRACVEVLVDTHKEVKPELTSGQKAARTRARNRQARAAVSGSPIQQTNAAEHAEAENV